jgi:glutathione S-transferase
MNRLGRLYADLTTGAGEPAWMTSKERSKLMTIELYVFPPSPRAFKVMALANHLGLDTAIHLVDLIKGDQKAPQYAALNPNMRMPTLKDGDYVLWESEAILQYLAGKKPDSGLFPSDERGRLDVTRWQFWDLAHWDPHCAVYLFENLIKPVVLKTGEPDQAALGKCTELFHRSAAVLDGQLKGKRWLTGDTLTVADFGLGAPLNNAEMARLPLEPYGEIRRWFAALSALPAWQRTRSETELRRAAAA